MGLKVYQLYPMGGGFSNNTENYDGTYYYVAAVNNKQAHFFARSGLWAKTIENPAGIVDVYTRSSSPQGWHRLWCGCRIHGGIGVEHNQGVRALRAALAAHAHEHHPPETESAPSPPPGQRETPPPPDEHLF